MWFNYFAIFVPVLCLVFLLFLDRKHKQLGKRIVANLAAMLSVTEILTINMELMSRLEELGDKDFVAEKRIEMMKRVMDKYEEGI